jgi:hypothetical protein
LTFVPRLRRHGAARRALAVGADHGLRLHARLGGARDGRAGDGAAALLQDLQVGAVLVADAAGGRLESS